MRPEILLLLCAVVVTCGVIVSTFLVPRFWHKNPFPSEIMQAATLPLYYPKELPYGYQIDADSFAIKKGLAIYHFQNASKETININIQKLPADFNVEQTFNKSFTNRKSVSTVYGTAHIGTLNGKTVANLVDGDTWVMAVYNGPGLEDDLATLMRSLERYKQH